MLRVLDLFSGIGGFSLGLERTGGFETVGFCEYDEYCQKVLKKHWPDVPIFNDIRKFSYEDEKDKIGPIDLICGGYPCQPFSQAGKRRGAEDDRHLWPEMFRIIKEFGPDWFLGENVAGHINMGLDETLSDLESEGYTTRAFVIPACAVDAQHQRNRVWIMAHAGHRGGGYVGVVEGGENAQGERTAHSNTPLRPSGQSEVMANTNKQRLQGHGRLQECAGERITGPHSWPLEEEWFAQSGMGRVASGIPKRVDRLKCLGNAVVPQVVEQIGYAILEAHWEQGNGDII